jgi:hypothetical protein
MNEEAKSSSSEPSPSSEPSSSSELGSSSETDDDEKFTCGDLRRYIPLSIRHGSTRVQEEFISELEDEYDCETNDLYKIEDLTMELADTKAILKETKTVLKETKTVLKETKTSMVIKSAIIKKARTQALKLSMVFKKDMAFFTKTKAEYEKLKADLAAAHETIRKYAEIYPGVEI